MNAPVNSNVLSPFAPAAVRQLESAVRYQLRRAPFGLTRHDLLDHLNEDGARQASILSVQMAVDRLIEAGDAEMQSRGDLDFVVAATPAHRLPPPKGIVVHQDEVRPLGAITRLPPMKAGLAHRLVNPVLATDETWDGLDTAPGTTDRSLRGFEAVLLWGGSCAGALLIAAACAIWGGWL